MRILLAGGSGAIGLPLVRLLRAAGHEVTAIHRAPAGSGTLLAAGATPVRVDVLNRDELLTALDGRRFDTVISQLTSLKKPPLKHADMAATNRLRIDGTANLIDVAERVGARRFVTQSMVFGYGYGDFGGHVLTESDTFGPAGGGRFAPTVAAMRSAERQVFEAPHVQGIALRYGLFYGPGPAGDALVDGLRRRRLPVIRRGGVLPWVHIDDAAAATVAALERGEPDSAYNIADDQPVSFSQLLVTMADALGAPQPRTVPLWLMSPMPYAKAMMTGGLQVSTARAKHDLQWSPRIPTYRDGVAELAAHYRDRAAS